MWFQAVPERKTVKNRVHLDLEPGAGGFEAEVDRLQAIGARQADAQPNADLVVLLDPEGNEFCLLRP